MNSKSKIFMLAGRIVLALVFLFAAIPKIMDPNAFAQAIENYRVFSGVAVRWAALFIPMLELLLAVFLLANFWPREQFILTAGLYIIFDVFILQAFLRGLDIDCGCFGVGAEQGITGLKILQNLLLTALAILMLWLATRRTKKSA